MKSLRHLDAAQQRLWFLQQAYPELLLFPSLSGLRSKAMRASALAARARRLMAGHEILRSTVEVREETPDFRPSAAPPPLRTLDLRGLPEDQRGRELERISAADACRPFEPGALLWRGLQLLLGEDSQALLLTVHSVAGGAGTLGRLKAAFLEAAETVPAASRTASGPREPKEDGAEASLVERLKTMPASLELPTDLPRPAVQSLRAGNIALPLPSALDEALDRGAGSLGVGRDAFLLAALQALLLRSTDEERLVLGVAETVGDSPSGARARALPVVFQPQVPGTAAVSGPTGSRPAGSDPAGSDPAGSDPAGSDSATSDPAGSDPAGSDPVGFDPGGSAPSMDPTFQDLASAADGALGQLRGLRGFHGRGDGLTFEGLLDELSPQRDPSRAPLYQVAYQGAGEAWGAAELERPCPTTELDLELFAVRHGGETGLRLRYAKDLFHATTVERLGRCLVRLLEQGLGNPTCRLSALALASPAEEHQLRQEWGPAPPEATAGLLHEPFFAVADRQPEAPAVSCGGEDLTYGELARRARQLAGQLRDLGLQGEERVGVLCRRRPSMVAAVLGVLEAGGAYLPLDPAYPDERLRYMVDDAQARAIVTDLGDDLPFAPPPGLPVLQVGEESPSPAEVSLGGGLGGAKPSPQSLAYVIYTSGSTGRPKGVAIRHGSAAATVRWARRRFAGDEIQGMLAATSLSFDLSVFELFLPLSFGGRVILVDDALGLPAAVEAAREGRGPAVTFVNTVPSVLAELLRSYALPESVKTVGLAGEPLPAPLAHQVLHQPGRPRLYNLYGPSEDTTYSTWEQVTGRDDRPLIGRPVDGTGAYVTDRRLRLRPLGVPGELVLGGASVARGYLGRPALTAERFVPDPFGAAGGRLYRTGDRVRHRPDGRLEYLDRLDRQVKVRGFRIEPGEVEAALLEAAGVAEAAVVPRPGADGVLELVAFVAAGSASRPAAGELRRHLEGELPAHFVPKTIAFLDALPRTPSGKIDRGSLRRRELTGREAAEEGTGTPPRTAAEELLAGLWQEVLGVEAPRREDDFFELGGHSLLASRLVSALREATGMEVSLGAVFESPRLADLARVLDAAGAAPGTEGREPIPRLKDRTRLPLTFPQEQLWLFSRLFPEQPVYNVAEGVRLRGPLRLRRLDQALGRIVARHEVLRSRFGEAGGDVFQVPLPEAAPLSGLRVVDLSGLPAPAGTQERRRLEAAEGRRPFDLSGEAHFRCRLLRGAGDDHDLLLTFHHCAVDGWSVEVFLDELGRLYQGGGEPAELPPLPVQVGDVGAWERRRWTPAVRARELEFWRPFLEGVPQALDLPADRPRPQVPSYGGWRLELHLDRDLTAGLRSVVRSRRITPFMLHLAAVQALLSRLSGQGSFNLGVPRSHRPRPETEALIGYFISMLVLPARVQAAATFEELLSQARRSSLAAQGHAGFPLPVLVEELGDAGQASRNPLFQTIFQVVPEPPPAVLEGLETARMVRSTGTSKMDLEMLLEDGGETFTGYLEASRDLFDETTVERWAGWWRNLLSAVAADPRCPLEELPLLGTHERHELVVEWGHGPEMPPPAFSHAFFEEQARRTPEAPALVVPSAAGPPTTVTYGELEARSRAVALRLRRLGIGPDCTVGVSFGRSPWAQAAVLGVLRAGGCYVPLDPEYPPDRLRVMVADSSMEALLTSRPVLDGLKKKGLELSEDLEVLLLDDDLPIEDGGALAPVSLSRENLAYVLFTSGSTGRPKGVALSHGALGNLIAWQKTESTPGPAGRTLHFASLSFDVSFQEMFSTWAAGGALVLVGEEVRRDPRRLLRWVEDAAVERLFLPFVALEALAQEAAERLQRDPPAGPAAVAAPAASLRHVLTAGEQLRMSPALRAWLEALESCRLHNQYGPTESHVTTAWTSGGPAREAPLLPPIGRPIAGHRAFVVDDALRPVVPGAGGELLLGGSGLARGYFRRPALTAERFVPDPCSGEAGARVYRTGDRVRWRSDGLLEFLGRSDDQVKIRGFRVEPAEVEAVLAAHPAVAEAVAVVREDPPGARRLVAYAVPSDGGKTLEAEELREYLRRQLPEHMVPAVLVPLQELPLTPSGKVDRRRLPAPVSGEVTAAPRTGEERALARIWTELLGQPQVGREDHFFDLGGHSLLAARVTARLRDRFGVDLAVRDVFETPVLSELARKVARSVAEASPRGVPGPLQPRRIPPGTPIPLSPAQERFFFLDRMTPANPAYVLPEVFDLEGEVDAGALQRAFQALLDRHEVLRAVYGMEGGGEGRGDGEPRQRVMPAAAALPLVDVSALQAADRSAESQRLLDAGAARPMDLREAPLIRCWLLRRDPRHHSFSVEVHHIACDGWGLAVLMDDLSALYRPGGGDSALAPLEVRYGDYALAEAEARWDDLEPVLALWREVLEDLPPELDLPLDRPRPAEPSYRGRTLYFPLPADLKGKLQAFGRAADGSLFMVLALALAVVLGRLTGQWDMLLGVPTANRRRPEVEPLVGCFVNVLLLRLRPSEERSGAEELRRLRRDVLALLAFDHVPFRKIMDDLQLLPRGRRSLLFAVLFQVLATPTKRLALEGLRATPRRVETGLSRMDLELTVTDTEERGGLEVGVTYDSGLFDATTVGRWGRALAVAAERIASASDLPLREISVLAPAEEHHLLVEWNDTAAPEPSALVHELFEEKAAGDPGRPAVVDRERRLTYGELNGTANRLARLLVSLGVTPGDPVAVLAERTALLPVCLLGVLKAGAHYLPLDVSHPEERIIFMLEDCRRGEALPLLLIDDALRHRLGSLASFARIQAVSLGSEEELRQRQDPGNPGIPGSGPQAAYLLYTSGSTGRPKGVCVPHGAVSNLLASMERWPGLTGDDRVLSVITAAFDMSVPEIFLPLTRGAQVVIADGETTRDGRRLRALVEESGATLMQATPATWRMLTEAGWSGDGTLKVLTGGEALAPDLAGRLLAAGKEVWDLYGPTEATVYCTGGPVREEPLTIGRPLANVRIHLLDFRLRPVPVGAVGEVFVGGAGLATGYHRRPALTAERFVPDPFTGEPGGRLYRVGDLARHRPDGRLTFLGRIDHQVKVRGFRIELGEIEALLAEHPAVRRCVAVAREDRPGDSRLVAYLVLDGDQPPPSPDGLKGFLGRRLPGYMVPSAFVPLDELPLTGSGKVDRRSLPAPEEVSGARSGAEVTAPRTPAERWAAEQFAELLGLPGAGRHDDFFDLGGHSLLALHLMTRIRRRFGLDLPLAALFQASTPEKVAELVEGETGLTTSAVVPLAASGETGKAPFFCCHGVGGNVFRMVTLARAMAGRRPFYGVQGWADLGDVDHMASVDVMADRYCREIQAVQPSGPYFLGGHSMGCIVAFEISRRLTALGETVAYLGLLDGPANPTGPKLPWFRSFNNELFLALELGIPLDLKSFQRLPKARRLQVVVEEGIKRDALPVGFTPEDAARYLKVYRISYRAWRKYRSRPWGGKAYFYSTKGANPEVRAVDPTDGWGRAALGGVEVVDVAGDHNTMLRRPHVEDLARRMIEAMEDAEAAPPRLVPVPAQSSSWLRRVFRLFLP